MMRNLAILGLMITAVVGYTFYSDYTHAPKNQDVQRQSAIQTRIKAPAFDFKTIEGRRYSLQEFSGKVVVLNFWASWCAPCVIEFPQMINLAKMTDGQAVFIFLSLDDGLKDIERFLKKHAPSLPSNVHVAWDEDKSISQDLFGTFKLPETFILSKDLMIEEKVIGADLIWDSPEMKGKIDALYTAP